MNPCGSYIRRLNAEEEERCDGAKYGQLTYSVNVCNQILSFTFNATGAKNHLQ